MDLASFIVGFFVGALITAVAMILYMRMMIKKMMSNFGNINMLLEMMRRGRP